MDSSLQGTVWYWRQGLRNAPMHSRKDWGDATKTKELYMPVKDTSQTQTIINELMQNEIKVDQKRTHSSFDVVPPGSLIIFAASSLNADIPEEKENIIRLRKYILEHGGTIVEGQRKKSVIKSFISALFGGGRK